MAPTPPGLKISPTQTFDIPNKLLSVTYLYAPFLHPFYCTSRGGSHKAQAVSLLSSYRSNSASAQRLITAAHEN